MAQHSSEHWDLIIEPQKSIFHFPIRDLWAYRDLWALLVKRDIVSFYKQTILGPIWFFIQPLFTMLVYMFIFGRLAGISTDGLPQPLFYLVGITCWNYFAACFTKTASIFKDNAGLLGKVYFPRLILPLSLISSNLVSFGVQMLLVLCCMVYYAFIGIHFPIHTSLLLIPLFILLMALLGLGLGLIITSLTTTYRDLVFLIQFGVQLLMYATPIIYPLSAVPEKYRFIIQLNPMTHIIEAFRYAFLGKGTYSFHSILYTMGIITGILWLGIVLFNKAERTFVDTI